MTEVIEKTENKKGYKKTKLGWIPEEWDLLKLGDFFTLTSGITKPDDLHETQECNDNPVYGGNGVIGYSKQVLLNQKVLIIGRVGEKCGCVHYLQTPCWITDNALYINSIKKNFNYEYMYYLLQKINLNKYRNKSGQPLISQKPIYCTIIAMPKIAEQEKVTEILSAWDDGIETLEKLIEQKEIFHKALMKNLLIGKKRFAEFSKNSEYKRTKLGSIPVDWQIKPLKLLFDKRMQKYSRDTEHNIFTNSATKGVVLQNEYFDRSIVTEENTSNYYVVGEDDFMYNPRISQNAPAGPINRNKLGITGIASPLYTIFKAKHDTIVDFYEQYFSSNLWNNSMFMVANQGARHDRLNITNNDFMNMPLPYPPTKEQEKIANSLIESYKEIQILNSKLEKLKEQKKGLMQKLLTGQIRVKV